MMDKIRIVGFALVIIASGWMLMSNAITMQNAADRLKALEDKHEKLATEVAAEVVVRMKGDAN